MNTPSQFSGDMSPRWAILGTMSRPSPGLAAFSAGCYEAPRAAALSGVPTRTVYDWAAKGIVVPSISPVQEKLWSYADLMALRIVAWLRRPKAAGADDDPESLPASPMPQVRSALAILDQLGMDLWSRDGGDSSPLVVDQRGSIHVRDGDHFVDLRGNESFPLGVWLNLLGPFDVGGHRGPDLLAPRPHLRIAPERVAGEPHVENTRLTTRTLAGMAARGFTVPEIAEMYSVSATAVAEAVDLEADLSAA